MLSYLLKISKILFLTSKFPRLLIVLKLILKILNYKNNSTSFKKKGKYTFDYFSSCFAFLYRYRTSKLTHLHYWHISLIRHAHVNQAFMRINKKYQGYHNNIITLVYSIQNENRKIFNLQYSLSIKRKTPNRQTSAGLILSETSTL